MRGGASGRDQYSVGAADPYLLANGGLPLAFGFLSVGVLYSAVCLAFKDGRRAMEVVVVVVVVGRSEQGRVDLSTLVENESFELLILLRCYLSSYFFNNLKFPALSSYLLPT